ncbi:hypothetical protein ACIPIN_01920 [Pseudomonas sp. NPDC087697]|uniref:hypothetical protein n=1 Tax=Pseudomonas sp. NPDC087697 TaxID=3364447 RepID=UPI0038100D1F
MLSNLTADEIKLIVRNFRSALDIKRDSQSIYESRIAIHQLTERAHQAGRLLDADLSCIIDLVLAYNWLEDAARAGPVTSVVNETYKYRPYTSDRLRELQIKIRH